MKNKVIFIKSFDAMEVAIVGGIAGAIFTLPAFVMGLVAVARIGFSTDGTVGLALVMPFIAFAGYFIAVFIVCQIAIKRFSTAPLEVELGEAPELPAEDAP